METGNEHHILVTSDQHIKQRQDSEREMEERGQARVKGKIERRGRRAKPAGPMLSSHLYHHGMFFQPSKSLSRSAEILHIVE